VPKRTARATSHLARDHGRETCGVSLLLRVIAIMIRFEYLRYTAAISTLSRYATARGGAEQRLGRGQADRQTGGQAGGQAG
jgi:hypothetical protein